MSKTMPDTTLVDMHRLPPEGVEVTRVEGEAWRIAEDAGTSEPLAAGLVLAVGDTIALGSGAVVRAGGLELAGGRRGHAHAFVSETAFRSSPSRNDVPKLLEHMSEIEEKMAVLGEDPLAAYQGPKTPLECARASEVAHLNLVMDAARELPEPVARRLGAVLVFVNDESAFVAMASVTFAKLRALMETLRRPIQPHLVEERTLCALFERVYGGSGARRSLSP